MDDWRYFVTYSGVKLPLRLVDPLESAELSHRNTYLRARFDQGGRLVECEKMVYGEIHLSHRYAYDEAGTLKRAEIVMDDETTVLEF
ncbi:DUF6156 family protein [Magnetospirillum aberrantis]|uniref:RHS repeat protein n=1 Tax=Magnetospirillum aberrantis SpK TaxID=908842 RepID=A0A7C9UWQ2_9PROT|nr:DUF6156 family protein [Magnetospirillum aberrantis]NFV82308.1 hypothetical protein [Magnetospirillum aberrantis SpK]